MTERVETSRNSRAESITIGTLAFGAKIDQSQAAEIVHRSLDAGVTKFDTANIYNAGRSEEILGRILTPFRDRVQIATKVGSPSGPELANNEAPLSRNAIRKAVDASLRRLNTDYIDLYYLHRPDWATPIEETLETLDELVRGGKVRAVGQSNFAAWQGCEMLCLAERNGWPRVGVAQQMYNLLARRLEDEYLPFARRFTVSTVAYNPLAGGLLTGKYRPDREPEPGSRFAQALYRQRYWNRTQLEAVEALREVASDAGVTLMELSLRWLWSRPGVDGVIVGASSLPQLEENLSSLQGPALGQEVEERVDEVWKRLGGVAPPYNR
jgi:aryl-alcohol dehydrogenase-like predicted oxidoreductase